MKHSDKSEKEIARMVRNDFCSLAFFLTFHTLDLTILSSLHVVFTQQTIVTVLTTLLLSSLLQLVEGGVDYEYLKERQKTHKESLAEIQTYLK